MGKKSSVLWCDASHGFWMGCKKCSPGCVNCYAKRDMDRYKMDFDTVTRTKGFDKPLKWKGPMLIFVNPWSDFFAEEADDWRDDAWEVMRNTPHLTYIILTKRPENINDRLPKDWFLPNVYLGVTVENQEMADKRIPILLEIPAVQHFVSIEPMLGPVDLSQYIDDLDYVVVGGESGPVEDVREMEEIWALDVIDLCEASGTKIMFKQWSAPKEGNTIGGNKYLDRLPMV